MNTQKQPVFLWYALIFLIVSSILIRFMAAFRFLFFIGLILMLVALGIWSIQYYRRRKAYESSPEGVIAARITSCQEQINKLQRETTDIERNITELKQDIRVGVDPAIQTESERLIKGFEAEQQLRLTKILFYNQCIDKLQRIVHQHKAAQQIARKRKKLQELQENNYESIAEMEALRSDIEFDRTYIETIETLSLKMLRTESLKDAQVVQKQLEMMIEK